MRIHRLLPLLSVPGSMLVLWACGSDNSSVDLQTPPDGGASTSSSGATASGSSGTSGSTSSSSGSSGGGDGSSGGAVGGDGGIDPPDARPGGDTTTVTCGATACSLPAQQCCVSELAGPGSTAYGCTPASDGGCLQPPGGGDVTSLKCSAQANCPANTVCCVSQVNNGAASECKTSCGGGEAQLCDPSAPDGGGCPQGDPCSNNDIKDWGLPNTYATCGGKGN